MTESEFNNLIDQTFEIIEDTLEDAESDMDYLNQGGVLTVVCENKSQVIFTRQGPVMQLWVAARSGGFHFDYNTDSQSWIRDSDQTPLTEMLSQIFTEQAGENFDFELTLSA